MYRDGSGITYPKLRVFGSVSHKEKWVFKNYIEKVLKVIEKSSKQVLQIFGKK